MEILFVYRFFLSLRLSVSRASLFKTSFDAVRAEMKDSIGKLGIEKGDCRKRGSAMKGLVK